MTYQRLSRHQITGNNCNNLFVYLALNNDDNRDNIYLFICDISLLFTVSLFSEPKSNGLNGVWDLSYPLNDDSEANAFETSMPSLESHQCKSLLEYGCDNGKCVPLSRYCDGTDDCGDQSDEPIACTSQYPTYHFNCIFSL